MGPACTWTPSRSSGPITCIRVEGNRASVKYRFTRAAGPGAPPQNGGVQVYIEDNGKAKRGLVRRPRRPPSRRSRRAPSTPRRASAPTRASTRRGRRSSPATSPCSTRAEPEQPAQVRLELVGGRRAAARQVTRMTRHPAASRRRSRARSSSKASARVVRGAAVELDDERAVRARRSPPPCPRCGRS